MKIFVGRYNRSTVSAGVSGVLTAELDAFIYDGTVLDYLVSQVTLLFCNLKQHANCGHYKRLTLTFIKTQNLVILMLTHL